MLPLQQIEMSYEMADASLLAVKLALDRKRWSIGFEEYFSGIYLAHREALLAFWRDSKKLDVFLRDSCGLSEPVWFYWIDFYMSVRNDAKWKEGMIVPHSRALNVILNEAAKLALKEAKKSSGKPQLGVEHFVKALAAHPELQFSRKMLESGMKRQALLRTPVRLKPRRRQD